MINGSVVPLTQEERMNIVRQQEDLSSNGLRCLGFAELELNSNVFNKDYKYAAEDDDTYSPNFPIGDKSCDAKDKR